MYLTKIILVCDQPGCGRQVPGEFGESKTQLRRRARKEKEWFGVGKKIYCDECKYIKYHPILSMLMDIKNPLEKHL